MNIKSKLIDGIGLWSEVLTKKKIIIMENLLYLLIEMALLLKIRVI